MSSEPLHSSQDFVRALKGAADPPAPGGPPKIDIALQAWNDSAFYVPSKAEIIADWILTKLLKEKEKEDSTNPIFDIRFWRLLSSVTEPQSDVTKGPHLWDNQPWLVNLLHRVPVGPVVVSVLSSFDRIANDDGLLSNVTFCLSRLWPISVQRMNVELLQSSFGAFISCALKENSNPGMVQLGKTISASYRDSLTNTTQKKKLYQVFLQSYLGEWLQCVSTGLTSLPPTLQTVVVDAGVETLFSLDVLRHIHDSNIDKTLLKCLQTLLASKRSVILQSSPKLLVHYIRSIKKHRGALFSQGSQLGPSLDEVHESAMNFFISLASLISDDDADKEVWRSRVELLEVVKSENIFNRKQGGSVTVFNDILGSSIKALHDAWKEELLDDSQLIMQCVSIIAKVDYDLIQPFVHMIVPLLIQIPGRDGLQFALLDIILDYHTKTRTMDALIQTFIEAISLPKAIPGGSQQTYQICASSPVMQTVYMQKIARALQTFLTESQCLPIVDAISTILKDGWQKIYAILHQTGAIGDNPKKKRRTSSAPVADEEANTQELAVVYSFTCRFASVVLSSLPMSSLSVPVQEEVRLLLQNFRGDFILHAISKSLKLLKKSNGANLWPLEITLAANLSLSYALDVSGKLSSPVQFDAKVCSKMSQLVGDVIVPELTVEMFRISFYSISIGQQGQHEALIDHALRYLEENLDRSDETFWMGHRFELIEGQSGRSKGALALLHMIIERWLPLIDHYGFQNQLNRLLQIFVSIKLPVVPYGSDGIRAAGLLMQILRSAEFWELPNIRAVFLDILNASTSALDSAEGRAPKTAIVLEKGAIYQLLLFFPVEYLSWQLLNDLVKRALKADVILSDSSLASRKEDVRQAIVTLRMFLKRAYVYSGYIAQESNDDLSKFLIHLLDKSASLDITSKDIFTKATLDLVEIYFSKLLKVSKKNGPQPVLDVLAIFNSNLFTNAPAASSWSFVTLVNLLIKEFPADSLPPEITSALAELYRDISSSLLPRVMEIIASKTIEQNVEVNRDLISGWHSLLCLQHWLEHEKTSDVPPVGQTLTTKLVQAMASRNNALDEQFGDLCTMSFAILVQELEMRPEAEHSSQLDLMVASYIAHRKDLNENRRHALNLYIGKACKKFTANNYSYTLSLLADSLSDVAHVPASQLVHLVHLSGLLLRDHPSHSLQHIQKFTTVAFNVFTEQEIFVLGPIELRLEVLEIVAQHCSDQPAALRSLDIAAIWLLLSKYLAPSQEHDHDSAPLILHKIITILSAIIRLRRDLITHGLPHLGINLRRLLLCMRGCRSQLGARQTDVVMHTQPRWIHASHAMGVEEAKILSRLLECLNTKTVVRAYTSSSVAPEAQKAESLAKPFSKHAAYVLKAYIEAMNDPLCVMPLDVRKELQPGIFALCEMVSEHSRDSLMISALDAGGKALLKALWRDYDKQRYVGKG